MKVSLPGTSRTYTPAYYPRREPDKKTDNMKEVEDQGQSMEQRTSWMKGRWKENGLFYSTCCCFIHESRGTVEESAQRPQCAGEGGASAGEVRTPRGKRAQEDAQRGKGRRNGWMKWTQDVGNRHHQVRGGCRRGSTKWTCFHKQCQRGTGGRQGVRRAAELALCVHECVRNTKELSQCETPTTGILSCGGGQTVIWLPIMHGVRDQGSGVVWGMFLALLNCKCVYCFHNISAFLFLQIHFQA